MSTLVDEFEQPVTVAVAYTRQNDTACPWKTGGGQTVRIGRRAGGPPAIVDLEAGTEVPLDVPLDEQIAPFAQLSEDGAFVAASPATGAAVLSLPEASSVYVMPGGRDVSVVTVEGRHLLAPLESLRNGIPLDDAALWTVKASDGYVVMHMANPDGSLILTGARHEPSGSGKHRPES